MTLQELADALGGEIRGHGKAAFVFVKRGSKAAELWPHEDGSWWIDTWNGLTYGWTSLVVHKMWLLSTAMAFGFHDRGWSAFALWQDHGASSWNQRLSL